MGNRSAQGDRYQREKTSGLMTSAHDLVSLMVVRRRRG
jgi:hypothetical protein